MGNNQSAVHHNRLSKPKTNTNCPVPVPVAKIESPVSVTSRYADLSAKGRQHIKDTLLSPVDSDFGSIVRPGEDELIVKPIAQIRGRTLSITSRSGSRANSRSNSISCFGSKHGSMTKLSGFADSKVSLVSHGQMDIETAIKLLQEVKKNASPEDLAALHEALEPTDASLPLMEQGLSRNTSLINRSSSSLTRRRSLVQTPGVATRNSPVDDRRKTWNSWKAPQLRPEDEEKWRSTPKHVSSSNRLLVPGPSGQTDENSTPRARTPGELDYSHLGNLKLGSLMVTNGAPSPAPSAKITKRKPGMNSEEDYFSPTEVGSSPLTMKTVQRRGHVRSKSANSQTTKPMYHTDVPVPAFRNLQLQTDIITQELFVHTASPLQQQNATVLASPRVHVQNADCFAQSYHHSLAPIGSASYREEAARILQGAMFELDASVPSTTTAPTAANRSELAAQVPNTKGQRPQPRTQDSGYSSGGSMCTSTRQDENHELASVAGRRSISPPKEGLIPAASPTELHTQILTQKSSAMQQKPAALATSEHSSWFSTHSSTSDATLSPQSPSSTMSKASSESAYSTPKRLQRKRPSHVEAPLVQACQPIPEGTIPDVPDNIRIKFTRRLSHTPGMECLTNTYPTKEHVLLPKPSANDAASTTTTTRFKQLAELEPDRPPTPPPHGRRKSLSLFRRKSNMDSKTSEKSEEMPTLDVVDLGTIATSLGTSPYDAAMSRQTRKSVTSPTHPHQLGNSLPRAKSIMSMDSQSAAEFARLRSKDRASMEFHTAQLPQQRRRSYHNLKHEAGEAKAAKHRPQSYVHDVPPVPHIDASFHRAGSQIRPQSDGQRRPQSELQAGNPCCEQNQARSHVMIEQYNHSSQRMAQRQETSVDWEAHSLSWSQRRKSIGEGLRTEHGMTEASASSINSRTTYRSSQNVESWGRFSGGLQYNYQGGGVIAGSAGTHAVHKLATSKSMQWKVQHGVDLSDVPIMLQRA
ncbi:hypothetical protein ACN47E_005000 [Coniothyrium glycines]